MEACSGKYRKQYLEHEFTARNRPGNSSPVFETPYGRVGVLILRGPQAAEHRTGGSRARCQLSALSLRGHVRAQIQRLDSSGPLPRHRPADRLRPPGRIPGHRSRRLDPPADRPRRRAADISDGGRHGQGQETRVLLRSANRRNLK